MQQWRLIPLLTDSGATQMAIDAWLLEQHRLGQMPSVLRFYQWSPVAISLGYHQHRYPEAWTELEWKGGPIDVVRRPTGGRAVLHQGELTYAVITSNVGGDRTQAYQTLCQFLLEGLQTLGIQLEYGTAGRGYIQNPNCFGTATAADLILPDGTKVIGSAQLRRGQAILQHGSIRLVPDPSLFQQVFGLDLMFPANLWSKVSIGKITDALKAAACQCFEMDYAIQPLTEQEWESVIAQSQKWHKLS